MTLTDTMPVVARVQDAVGVRPMRWGIVPAGERANPRPRLLANARSETAATMAAFRKGIASRRCLVPANGFYEWETRGGVKLPHLFTLADEEPFAFAGIWDPAADKLPETYCLLTTQPNELVAKVHDRMPVILTAETMGRWIGDQPLAEADYKALVSPLDTGAHAIPPCEPIREQQPKPGSGMPRAAPNCPAGARAGLWIGLRNFP